MKLYISHLSYIEFYKKPIFFGNYDLYDCLLRIIDFLFEIV